MDFLFETKGVSFASPFMNASGPLCTSELELEALGKSAASAIVLKSMTLSARTGNECPKYFENEFGSINSNGLENPGYREYCKLIPKLGRFQKPVVASCVGFNEGEFETMIHALDLAGANVIEANLSCPNIAGKPQVAYDLDAAQKYLEAIRSATNKPLWVKLPPYFEPVHRREMARLLLNAQVDGVTLINSVGNALLVDWQKEQTVIKPKKGLGGLGGRYIKPVALANVWSFFGELKGKIPIIGAGGVYTGVDAFEFLLCGASLVQIGSAYKREGTAIFARIEKELGRVLAQKGYGSFDAFVGKLKTVQEKEYGFDA